MEIWEQVEELESLIAERSALNPHELACALYDLGYRRMEEMV